MSDFESRREDYRRETYEDRVATLPRPDDPPRCGSEWRLVERTTYGDDADGRRGVPLYVYECINHCCELEVLG